MKSDRDPGGAIRGFRWFGTAVLLHAALKTAPPGRLRDGLIRVNNDQMKRILDELEYEQHTRE